VALLDVIIVGKVESKKGIDAFDVEICMAVASCTSFKIERLSTENGFAQFLHEAWSINVVEVPT